MLPNILLVASQVLMLFLMIAVGWFCAARKILTKDGADQLSRISLNIITPCVIIDALQRDRDPQVLAEIMAGTAALHNSGLQHGVLVMLDLQKPFHSLIAGIDFQLLLQLSDEQDHEMADQKHTDQQQNPGKEIRDRDCAFSNIPSQNQQDQSHRTWKKPGGFPEFRNGNGTQTVGNVG